MIVKKDDFGDRMKEYEMQEAGRKFIKLLPVVARLDGKCFSKFTKGLGRPFDIRLSNLMIATTQYLVEETCAVMGYTQSDEITLAWYSDNRKSSIYYDGRLQKMIGDLSAAASVFFNKNLDQYIKEKTHLSPRFDARVWQLPNLEEAANAFLWREQDATKNSISMAASHYFSHKELHNKTGNNKLDLLLSKGINWNDYPDFFKRGTFVQKTKVIKEFTEKEIEKLPINHNVRKHHDFKILRSEIKSIKMPSFSKVTNRADVIFNGALPIMMSE